MSSNEVHEHEDGRIHPHNMSPEAAQVNRDLVALREDYDHVESQVASAHTRLDRYLERLDAISASITSCRKHAVHMTCLGCEVESEVRGAVAKLSGKDEVAVQVSWKDMYEDAERRAKVWRTRYERRFKENEAVEDVVNAARTFIKGNQTGATAMERKRKLRSALRKLDAAAKRAA